MTRTLSAFCSLSTKQTVTKHIDQPLNLRQKRWLHPALSAQALLAELSAQPEASLDISLSGLRKRKAPIPSVVPNYLREIWLTEETWILPESALHNNNTIILLRPSIVPILREELWKRHSTGTEIETIIFNSMDIQSITKEKDIRRKMKDQLRRCKTTRDIFRVAVAALQSKRTAQIFTGYGEFISRAFYQTREFSSDISIAAKIAVLIKRFDREGLSFKLPLFYHGIAFAFRSRNLNLVKRFLWEFRSRGLLMSRGLFRLIIAKCSIGRRGYGEIRNGQWNREDMKQILLGFTGAQPGKEYHLSTFMDRNDWQSCFAFAFVQILARCGFVDEMWKEWLIWKQSPTRLENAPINSPCTSRDTAGVRGDCHFVQEFIIAGDYKRAWKVLAETRIDPKLIQGEKLRTLLSWSNLATIWNESLREELMQKYEEDLDAMEHFLGVEWISDGRGGGYHRPTIRLNEALEELSDEHFFRVYGLIRDHNDAHASTRSISEG
jgi:hypothetical protein